MYLLAYLVSACFNDVTLVLRSLVKCSGSIGTFLFASDLPEEIFSENLVFSVILFTKGNFVSSSLFRIELGGSQNDLQTR